MVTTTSYRRSKRAAIGFAQLLSITALTLLSAAPATAQSLATPNEQTKIVAAAFAQSFNDKNAASVAALYTADADLLAPGVPLIIGHTEIKAYYEKLFNSGASDLALSPIETITALNAQFVLMLVTFEVALQPTVGTQQPDDVAPESTRRRISGKGLVVFRRDGNAWRIASATFNGDEPLLEAPRPTTKTK